MKRIFVVALALGLFACNNANAPATAEAQAFVPANTHGFTPQYSASFVMDSAANAETILALWQVWQDGDLSKGRQYFADSFMMFTSDGGVMQGATDDVMKQVQGFRSSLKSVKSSVDAIFATRSTDRNENWVAVWGTEIRTDSTGKADSISLQETWRLNAAGKVDFLLEYMRKGIQPPPPNK